MSSTFHVSSQYLSLRGFTACKKVSDCLIRLVQQEAVKSKVAEQRKKFGAEDDTRKLVVNDELVGMRPQIRSLHPRMAEELKRAVDDGRVCDAVAQAEVPDLWMKHVQLSINLEMLRNNWRGVKKKTGETALRNKFLAEFADRYANF